MRRHAIPSLRSQQGRSSSGWPCAVAGVVIVLGLIVLQAPSKGNTNNKSPHNIDRIPHAPLATESMAAKRNPAKLSPQSGLQTTQQSLVVDTSAPADTLTTTTVQCMTTKGGFYFRPRFDWAPRGADRLMQLVDAAFFTNMVFFRVPPLSSNPLAQFGVSPNATLRRMLHDPHGPFQRIDDDDPSPKGLPKAAYPAGRGQSSGSLLGAQLLGHFCFAGAGKDSRTYQMWLARDDFTKRHPSLGKNSWDIPIAEILPKGEYQHFDGNEENGDVFVDEGPAVVSKLFQVGDMKPWGNGPDTNKMVGDRTFNNPSTFPGTYLREGYLLE